MRMEGQSRQFTTLTATRATATLVMRLVLIVGFHLGVLGFVLADVIVGIVFTGILARWFRPLLRFTFRARCSIRRCVSGCRGCRTASRSR